jgi:hypothetical protein
MLRDEYVSTACHAGASRCLPETSSRGLHLRRPQHGQAEDITGDLANPCPGLLAAIHQPGRRLLPQGTSPPHRGFNDQNHYPERCWCVPHRQQRAPAARTPTGAVKSA